MARAVDGPDRIGAALVWWVRQMARRPWAVLGVGAVALVGSVYLAFTHLEYHTQRNDLISAEKECQRRWQKYVDVFGDDDDLIFVVKGVDRARMQAATRAIAAKLNDAPTLYDRVFSEVDFRGLESRSLLFVPTDELRAIDRRLEGMGPLLGRFNDVSWQALSLQALLFQASAANNAKAAGKTIPMADAELLKQLPAIFKAAEDSLAEPSRYENPWALSGNPTDDVSRLREPQAFFTPDGVLAFVLARPTKASESFTPAREACDHARSVLRDVQPDFPELSFGLTGLPVLETDEMAASEQDSNAASWYALLGVAVLYLVVYRGFRYPLLTVGTLLTGTIWALGWATLTVGHLNILSATFAVMIIGMGDYGVLWVARYDQERQLGLSLHDALRATAMHCGPGIATAALTTSLAFFATMFADFKAVAELGWIAGSGVLLCAVACLTVLPALLTLLDRQNQTRTHVGPRPTVLPFPESAQPFMPGLSRRPRFILAIAGLVVVVASVLANRVQYDSNLLNLQARGLDSVNWEHELIDHAAGATWDAVSIAQNQAEALELKAKYESLAGVGRVVEAASLIPIDQAAKLPIVESIHAKLNRLPKYAPAAFAVTPARLSPLLANFPAGAALAKRLDAPDAAAKLQAFDNRLKADLLNDLTTLRTVSEARAIAVADLPTPFRSRYIGRDGAFLVRAYAKDSLWHFDALAAFTTEVQTVDPNASGKAFRTLEGLRQMKTGFERAGLLALAIIVTVLWLDFRAVRPLLLGLFPLVVGIVATLGVMGLAGVPLNPANLIALPLIVGVGVDNGVHVLHDYQQAKPGKLYRLGSATGWGITVASLTTILGFGTLMTARHQGMASLGFTLTVGVAFCMLASIVVLPAILRLRDQSRLHRAKPTIPQRHPTVTRTAAAA